MTPKGKMIKIEKGIVIFLKDGTIINFSNGNDEEYQAWIKTKEAKKIAFVYGSLTSILKDLNTSWGDE